MNDNTKLTKQQEQQFHLRLTATNVARLKVCAWIVIVLECILIARNVYRHGWTFHYYVQLYLALLVVSIVTLLLLARIAKMQDLSKQTTYSYRLLTSYYLFILYWGVIITVLDQQSYGHVTAFLTNFMTATLLFVVSPKKYASIHALPIVALFVGIFIVQQNFNIAMAHFINISVFIIFCAIGSRMIYRSYYKNFYQEIQLSKKNEELAQIAITDPLTEVYNVRGMRQFVETNEQLVHQCVTVMLLDIDYFKRYNDYYGHKAGDEVLKKVAETIKQTVSPSHFVARVGGEEFMVIAYNLTAEQSEQLAQAIRANIEHLKIRHDQSLVNDYITISLGYVINCFEEYSPSLSFDQLHHEADQALYEVKEHGRNAVKVYQEV